MRQSRFTETEIVCAAKQVELGIPAREIARKHGVNDNTVYLWRRKYNGVSPGELKRVKELVAELRLDKEILQNVLRENSEACTQARAALRDSRGPRDLGARSVQGPDASLLGVSMQATQTQ